MSEPRDQRQRKGGREREPTTVCNGWRSVEGSSFISEETGFRLEEALPERGKTCVDFVFGFLSPF